MSRNNNRQKKALRALNLDLFRPEQLKPPAPATLHTKIQQQAQIKTNFMSEPKVTSIDELPDIEELYRRFEMYNWYYFGGKLPRVRIEYSNRMTSAGSYTPDKKLIKIGRKYHEIFPEEINDTLKHEMIHIRYLNHDRNFKKEAVRIGASIKAQLHPALQRPPKYVYFCPECRREYPRQRRLRMASCGYCSSGRKYNEKFKLILKKNLE